MASYPRPRGPVPKPDSKRRRYAKPKSHGAAGPTTAPAADTTPRELGIDNVHPFAAALWDTVQQSCEAAFYSEADWVRLRLELFYANTLLAGRRQLTPSAWSAVQSGMNEMLLSPAVKRRAGIELQSHTVDVDEEAAVSMTGKYRQALKSV
jgi:hypothetical protein